MIRQEQLVAAYQAYGNPYYSGANSASPLAATRKILAEDQGKNIGAVQASPSVRVSLSEQALALSRSESAAPPQHGSALSRPDSQVLSSQAAERQRGEARYKAHSAQLRGELRQLDEARNAKWAARGLAHDMKLKQQGDAQVAKADAQRQAANAPPKQAPQVRPLTESVNELSKAVAQNMSSPAVQAPPPPKG